MEVVFLLFSMAMVEDKSHNIALMSFPMYNKLLYDSCSNNNIQRRKIISDWFSKEYVQKLMNNLNLLEQVKLDPLVVLYSLKSQELKELATLVT